MNDINQKELENLTNSEIINLKKVLFLMIFACLFFTVLSFTSAVLMIYLIKDGVEVILFPASLLVIDAWFCVWLLLQAWSYIDVYKVVKEYEKSRKLRKISS